MPATATTRREVLPQTRRSVTHKFAINGHEGYLSIGLFEDGRPGEIFIKMSKEGSTLSGLIQGFCRAFSLCLQHGLPIDIAEGVLEQHQIGGFPRHGTATLAHRHTDVGRPNGRQLQDPVAVPPEAGGTLGGGEDGAG